MAQGKRLFATIPAALLAGGLAMGSLLSGCASTAPQSAGDRAALSAGAQATLATYKAKDPTLAPLLKKAVGWAIFPNIGKGGFILGGSYGRGEVYEHGKLIGFADISEVTAGAQVGAQTFSQILVFLRQSDLDAFKRGSWAATGNMSAIALTKGGAGTTDPKSGVIALVDATGGLMAEAAVGGQHFRFSPK
jgi:lipid-binding SYLF domain-containing protein